MDKQFSISQVLEQYTGFEAQDVLDSILEKESSESRVLNFLVSTGHITDDERSRCLAALLNCRVIDEADAEAEVNILIQQEGLQATELNLAYLFGKNWVCVGQDKSGTHFFLTSEPEQLEVKQYLMLEGIESQIYITTASAVRNVNQLISEIEFRQSSSVGELDANSLRALASEAPIVNLVNSIITKGVLKGASDIHIEPQKSEWKVRLRVDGLLTELETLPENVALPVISRIKILSGMDIAEKRRPQDGKISTRAASKSLDIRVSTLPVAGGENVVMRLLMKGSLSFDLTTLGFEPDLLEYIEKDLSQTAGVILLTGPTGSGKTTTLYSFIEKIKSPETKFITLEDPVEYKIEGISQMQVNSDIGFTFAAGLRSILRQDPDVIMVGEIRDSETAQIALQSSMTGHLVFSTVHTNDAPSAYSRLTDLGVEEFLLNEAILGVIAQRLLRKLCSHCKVEHPESAEILEREDFDFLADKSDFKIYKPTGCPHCNGSGFAGRSVISEYLPNSNHIKQLKKDDQFSLKAREYMESQQLRSLKQDVYLKVAKGVTSMEEAIRVVGL